MRPGLLAPLIAAVVLCPASPALATPPLVDQLCQGRTPCSIAKVYPADPTVTAQPVRIIELNLGRRNPEDGMPPCRPFRREFWRVVGPGNRGTILRLMALCNDGYGAAGVGEDRIIVSGNRIVHHQFGGSASRWDVKRTISINPVRVIRRESCSFHTLTPGFEIVRWSWDRFRGQQIMKFRPDPKSDDQDMGCAPDRNSHRFPLVPRLGGAVARGIQGAPALGTCALEVRADGNRGSVIRGTPAPKGQGARMRVLALGKHTLLITVEAPAFRAGKGWRDSDHVQIWQAGFMSAVTSLLRDKPMRMFAVRAADGKTFLGHGETKARPEVVMHKVATRARGAVLHLRLTMPREVSSLTVAFAETGTTGAGRVTATSRLKPGNPLTLGGTFDVVERGAACVVRNGRLDAVNAGNRALLRETFP